MRVTVEAELKMKCPRVALGLVLADVQAGAAPPELRAEMNSREAQILGLPEPRAVLEAPAILATRAGYKALGKDPSRYRGSAEALLRRIVSGKHFPEINSVVDIVNLVSVESRFSIGLYDLAKVKGDIVFRAGRAGETYKGIGKYDLNLEELPLFSDEEGPHGSPTSDSERTMVAESTRRVAGIVISFGGAEKLPQACARMTELFQKYAQGNQCSTEIIP